MIIRDKFDYYIDRMMKITKRYGDENSLKALRSVSAFAGDFDLKVLFVGHFNAGKSALINAALKREGLLTEAQLPQTALATELHLCENSQEEFFAFTEDNFKVAIKPDDDLDANEYSHAEYYIDSDFLKELRDYTIVDTPGFDSGIENHNKALMNYIGKGSAYILVLDIDKGGPDSSAISYLNEVSNYSDHLIVLLNKCDKKIPDDIASVKALTEEALALANIKATVFCTSKFDDDLSEKLFQAISSFDAQKIFDDKIRKALQNEIISTRNMLQILLNHSYMDTEKFDQEIRKYEQATEEIKKSFEREKVQSESDLLENGTEKVISEINIALNAKIDDIADAIVAGSTTAAESIILESVRPVILKTVKDLISAEIDEIIYAINLGTLFGSQSAVGIKEVMSSVAAKTKDLVASGDMLEQHLLRFGERNEHNGSTKGLSKALLTGIAVFTDIIAPVLEIAIIFLPDVINLVKTIFGESEHTKIRNQLNHVVFPQIREKLYAPIQTCIEESYRLLVGELQSSMEEKLYALNQMLKQTKEDKQKTVEDFEQRQTEIKESINELEQIEQEMRYC